MEHGSHESQYTNSGVQEQNLHFYKTQLLFEVPFLEEDKNLISVRLDFALHFCLLLFQGYSDLCESDIPDI